MRSICLDDGSIVTLGAPIESSLFEYGPVFEGSATEVHSYPRTTDQREVLVFGEENVEAILVFGSDQNGTIRIADARFGQTKSSVRDVLAGEGDILYGSNRALLISGQGFRTYFLFSECPGSPEGDIVLRDDQLEDSTLIAVLIANERGLELMGDYITHPCRHGPEDD